MGKKAAWLLLISIHAPVKGATVYGWSGGVDLSISIHAPVKGATSGHAVQLKRERDFNPRSREGSDQRRRRSYSPRVFQSTLP